VRGGGGEGKEECSNTPGIPFSAREVPPACAGRKLICGKEGGGQRPPCCLNFLRLHPLHTKGGEGGRGGERGHGAPAQLRCIRLARLLLDGEDFGSYATEGEGEYFCAVSLMVSNEGEDRGRLHLLWGLSDLRASIREQRKSDRRSQFDLEKRKKEGERRGGG